MNTFVNIPVPAANGSGPAVDVSAFGASKTVSVAGPFDAAVTIEYSNEAVPTSWAPLVTFNNPDGNTYDFVAHWMRATVRGYKSGTPQCDVGGPDHGASFASLPVTVGNGAGAAVDVSGLGTFKTVTVGGAYRGNVQIEISEDGITAWSQIGLGFPTPGGQSQAVTAHWMRAVRSGVPLIDPGLPIVDVGGAQGADDNTIDVEDEGVNLGAFSVLNFVGGGVTATDAGGGVAQISVPAPPVPAIIVEDEGIALPGVFTTLNFTGGGIAATDSGGGIAQINVPTPTVVVEDEGVALGSFVAFNFVGGGVTASDAGGGLAQISIPAPPTPAIIVEDEGIALPGVFTTLNFTGGGVTATNSGGGVAQVSVPSATPPGNAIMFWGCDDVGAAVAARFIPPGFEVGLAPTTDRMQIPVPRAGTLKNLFVRHNAAAGNGQPVTYTVFVNGAATAITCNLATGAIGQASDVAHSVVVAAGDRVSIRASKGAVVGSGVVDLDVSLEVAA